jgi:hypothetical protein
MPSTSEMLLSSRFRKLYGCGIITEGKAIFLTFFSLSLRRDAKT